MSEQEDSEFFDPVSEINKLLSDERPALPSIYKKIEKLDVVGEGKAIVASANAKALPTRRIGKFEMLEVLERSLNRTVLNLANPGERVFTALRELSDFVNMATTGAQPKIANAHRDLLPVGHPLSTREHNFSQEEVAQFHAEWMSADPRIAEEFRPLVASAYRAPEASLEREYVIAKLETTSANEVPRDVILGLTAGIDPYGGGNSFLARSMRARAQRRDRRGRFAWMGGGARVWLGKALKGISTLFRFAGYDSKTDTFDLEIFNHPTLGTGIYSVPADKVEAIKAILPDSVNLGAPKPTLVSKNILVDPATLVKKEAPTGWEKISSKDGVDVFRSADGWIATRYANSASAPNEPSITRVRGANDDKSINPDLPVYHLAKGSNDGTVVDKPFAVTQSWGDTQALLARYDKKMAPKEEQPKATLEGTSQEFIDGWTKGIYQVAKSDNQNPYLIEKEDTANGKPSFTDPSGRYIAVKLATVVSPNWGPDANGIKERSDSLTRAQVLDSGKPIHTFDGAQKWDGNVENLYRLERVKSDGRREVLGFYQDPEDIEKDTEIPPSEDKPQDFYESVIADTLQWGGNTIDFVDGNSPQDGYIIAHEPDVLKQDGTIGKREEIYTPEQFTDPVEGPKILREFALKNSDKLTQQGFYLGTWLDTVDVTDENGKVIDQREMVFLDVSEYEKDFDKAFDKAEARGELAYYGVSEGKSFYVKDEKHRQETLRKTPILDLEENSRLKQAYEDAKKNYNQWWYANKDEYNAIAKKGLIQAVPDEQGRYMPNPRLEQENKELYDLYLAKYNAQVAYSDYQANYLRSIFEMSPSEFGLPRRDPGAENYGLSQDDLKIRDRYVADDVQTIARNKNLRDGGEPTQEDLKLDYLIKQSSLKDDTVFYRGIALDPELVKEMSPGDSFYNRAFSSTALNKEVALIYVNGRQPHTPDKVKTVFRMLCPKGMNAIHVGGNEVILPRNTKMRILRKSEVDGITYFDVDVEPQTKEEIDARIQGRVPKPEESKDGSSSSELPGNDGGGTDGLGDQGPFPVNYGPKPAGQEQTPRVTDPNNAIWFSTPKDLLGVSLNDIIGEATAINQYNDPEKHLAKRLKAHVAQSLTKKLKDLDNEEFLKMAVSLRMFFKDDLYWGDDSLKDISTIPVLFHDKDGTTTYYTTIRGLVLRGPMGDILPKDLIDRLNTERISRKDAKEVVRLMNKSDKHPDLNKIVFINKDNEEYMGILRESVASNLVAQWASTSNGDNAMSLAIQDLAFKEFGVDKPAEWRVNDETLGKISEIKNNHENFLRKFLRAQYDLTQEYFQKKGISKITLYRGVKNFTAHDMTKSTFPTSKGFTASIRLRPLSAWSTSEGIAIGFSRGADSKIFRKEFDVKDIFAFPGTGVGCYDEKEMVVLGGVTDSVDIADYSPVDTPSVSYNSPEPQAITYKEDQPQIQVNNAPISNAPKKMSNTERKRLERAQKLAEKEAAPSSEEVKQQMEQARQDIAQVAQAIPESVDSLFDSSNPLNILNARNITNDITGSRTNRNNLSKDDLLSQKLLFMEPTKEWYDLLDRIEKSGEPFAKQIISRIKQKHDRLIKKIEQNTIEERQAQVEYDNTLKELHNVVNTLVNNALANPNDVPGLNVITVPLMAKLDTYFNGNPNNEVLVRNPYLLGMALMSLYATNDPRIAQANPDFDANEVSKVITDLVNKFRAAYTRYGSNASGSAFAVPDRTALVKEVQRIYIENLFGGLNPTNPHSTIAMLAKLSHDSSLDPILPKDSIKVISSKSKDLRSSMDRLTLKRAETISNKKKLAKELSDTTKEVLSESGLEFNHGVKLSANDITWTGVHDFQFGSNPVTKKLEFQPTQMPDYIKNKTASELRNVNGIVDVVNEAIQSYPKPVALALKQFLIDNKSSFSFFTGSRGVTALVNPDELYKAHDIGDLSNVIKKLGISGYNKDEAVETTVHELLHLIVNGIFRNQMNSIAWAKQSKETNIEGPNGKISHNFVDSNYGNIGFTMNGDYLDAEDIMSLISANELGAASPNYAGPYIGKYGVAAGAQVALGQSPFSHGELLSTLFESLLGGGLSGMFSTYMNPKRVLSGTNPDGTPKYISMDSSVFSEGMMPFGVSMIVLLNELAKQKLGIA